MDAQQGPSSTVNVIMFAESWRNEQTLLLFRGAIWCSLGLLAIALELATSGTISMAAPVALAWGAVNLTAIRWWLAGHFHERAVMAIIALDNLVLVILLQVAYAYAAPGDPAAAVRQIRGAPVNFMLLTMLSALRYSRRAALCSSLCAITGLCALGVWNACMDATLVIHIAEFGCAGAFLVHVVDRQLYFVQQVKQREALARFLPAPLVERIVQDPLALALGGQELEATVLFADIRGFTGIAGRHAPAAIVAFLNRYFTEMVEEIFAHGGVLDKFIGDGICAVFTGTAATDRANRALACGAGMLRRVESLNLAQSLPGETALRIGIGVHTGSVVAGNIGSPLRLEYTHIGDAVNVASRIESLCKTLNESFLVSAMTLERADESMRAEARKLAPIEIRGKSEPLTLYAISGLRTP